MKVLVLGYKKSISEFSTTTSNIAYVSGGQRPAAQERGGQSRVRRHSVTCHAASSPAVTSCDVLAPVNITREYQTSRSACHVNSLHVTCHIDCGLCLHVTHVNMHVTCNVITVPVMDVMDIMECDKWHVQVQCRVVSVPLDNEMWRSILTWMWKSALWYRGYGYFRYSNG